MLLKWIKIFWLCKKCCKVWNCWLLVILYFLMKIFCVLLREINCLLLIFLDLSVFLDFNYLIGMIIFICGSCFVIVSIFFFKCLMFGYLFVLLDFVLFIVKNFFIRCFLYGLVWFDKELYILLVSFEVWGYLLVWVCIKIIWGNVFGNFLEWLIFVSRWFLFWFIIEEIEDN